MQNVLENAVKVLNEGGVILCPTDTIVGLSCLASNLNAIERIFDIKKRPKNKSLIILVSSDAMLNKYVEDVPEIAWDLIDCSDKPITIIYNNPKNLPSEILASDGSIGIRIVRKGFCNKVIHKLNQPIISTSANLSGAPTPTNIDQVSKDVLSQLDYVVNLPTETTNGSSSSIIKVGVNGEVKIIRS